VLHLDEWDALTAKSNNYTRNCSNLKMPNLVTIALIRLVLKTAENAAHLHSNFIIKEETELIFNTHEEIGDQYLLM